MSGTKSLLLLSLPLKRREKKRFQFLVFHRSVLCLDISFLFFPFPWGKRRHQLVNITLCVLVPWNALGFLWEQDKRGLQLMSLIFFSYLIVWPREESSDEKEKEKTELSYSRARGSPVKELERLLAGPLFTSLLIGRNMSANIFQLHTGLFLVPWPWSGGDSWRITFFFPCGTANWRPLLRSVEQERKRSKLRLLQVETWNTFLLSSLDSI